MAVARNASPHTSGSLLSSSSIALTPKNMLTYPTTPANVCSQLLLAHLWPVGPVLPGEYGHAHQHLRVVRHALGRQLLPFECFGKNVFNAYGDVSHQRAE